MESIARFCTLLTEVEALTEEFLFWRFILDHLDRGEAAGLLIVVASVGSTPRKVGARMAVAADGSLFGTIGGGAVEQQYVDRLRLALRQAGGEPCIAEVAHRDSDSLMPSGMICGGAQTVLIYPCAESDRTHLINIIQALESREHGLLRITPRGIAFEHGHPSEHRPAEFVGHSTETWEYRERLGGYSKAFLIGGGHVSRALSRILATLEFHTVVFDERPGLNTLVDNPYVHEKIIVPFDQVHRHIPEGEDHYAVIMTPSHRSDERVLAQLIEMRLRFLGMLGSRTKIASIMQRLGRSIAPERLQRVHAPVGVPINSHTPAEIAVSIAAEMIKVRNTATLQPRLSTPA